MKGRKEDLVFIGIRLYTVGGRVGGVCIWSLPVVVVVVIVVAKTKI